MPRCGSLTGTERSGLPAPREILTKKKKNEVTSPLSYAHCSILES